MLPGAEATTYDDKKEYNIFKPENLIMEAIQDLIKEEIQRKILNRVDSDKKFKPDLKKAFELLLEAKVKESYAYALLIKSGADLSLRWIPSEMKIQMRKKLAEIMEKEMEQLMAE